MTQPTPIELLKAKLNELERALQHSFLAYQNSEIDEAIHQTHKDNLEPAIWLYKRDIQFLENWQVK